MNRTLTLPVLAAASLLALAGCASTSSPSSDAASSNPSVGITTHSVVVSSAGPSSTPTSAKPTTAAATPSSAASCDPGPDVLVWTRVPGLPDSAQRIGSKYIADCTSSFDFVRRTSPTGPGYCTEAAWASDNPGYDENATPAKRLKKVVVMVGPAC